MPRTQQKEPGVTTPGQAQYIVSRLVAEGRITIVTIAAMLREIPAEIAAIERRLGDLRYGKSSAEPTERPASRPTRRTTRAPRRRRHSVAGKLGLRFSGLIRHLPPKVKDKLKALRAKKGVEAAIAAAEAANRK
jgi:hypothetical protein